MVLTVSKILVLIACILAVVAFVVVMVDASNPKLWPECIASRWRLAGLRSWCRDG